MLWPHLQPLEARGVSLHSRRGIYAFKKLADLLRALEASGLEAIAVVGEVSLWGTVIEFERGYRASFAYPYSFYLLKHDQYLNTKLHNCSFYRVEIYNIASYDEYL